MFGALLVAAAIVGPPPNVRAEVPCRDNDGFWCLHGKPDPADGGGLKKPEASPGLPLPSLAPRLPSAPPVAVAATEPAADRSDLLVTDTGADAVAHAGTPTAGRS
ncbi:hypothetical protein [Actinomadura sp. 3N508]|uniref:hypothetical protein n=1 Tax=Actinomadura sp. 3N508 TaxID=3375153 RepID=UPI0037AE2300